jgi:hypothetical protein
MTKFSQKLNENHKRQEGKSKQRYGADQITWCISLYDAAVNKSAAMCTINNTAGLKKVDRAMIYRWKQKNDKPPEVMGRPVCLDFEVEVLAECRKIYEIISSSSQNPLLACGSFNFSSDGLPSEEIQNYAEICLLLAAGTFNNPNHHVSSNSSSDDSSNNSVSSCDGPARYIAESTDSSAAHTRCFSFDSEPDDGGSSTGANYRYRTSHAEDTTRHSGDTYYHGSYHYCNASVGSSPTAASVSASARITVPPFALRPPIDTSAGCCHSSGTTGALSANNSAPVPTSPTASTAASVAGAGAGAEGAVVTRAAVAVAVAAGVQQYAADPRSAYSYAVVKECARYVWNRVYWDPEAGCMVEKWKANPQTRNLKFSSMWVCGVLRRHHVKALLAYSMGGFPPHTQVHSHSRAHFQPHTNNVHNTNNGGEGCGSVTEYFCADAQNFSPQAGMTIKD